MVAIFLVQVSLACSKTCQMLFIDWPERELGGNCVITIIHRLRSSKVIIVSTLLKNGDLSIFAAGPQSTQGTLCWLGWMNSIKRVCREPPDKKYLLNFVYQVISITYNHNIEQNICINNKTFVPNKYYDCLT